MYNQNYLDPSIKDLFRLLANCSDFAVLIFPTQLVDFQRPRARLLSIHYKPLNQEVTKGVYNVSFFCPNTLGIILSIPQQTTNTLIA